jgi:hypothetical protein
MLLKVVDRRRGRSSAGPHPEQLERGVRQLDRAGQDVAGRDQQPDLTRPDPEDRRADRSATAGAIGASSSTPG